MKKCLTCLDFRFLKEEHKSTKQNEECLPKSIKSLEQIANDKERI